MRLGERNSPRWLSRKPDHGNRFLPEHQRRQANAHHHRLRRHRHLPRLWRWLQGWHESVRVLPQACEFMAQACRAAQPGTGHLWLSIADEAATIAKPAGIHRHHTTANAADQGRQYEAHTRQLMDGDKATHPLAGWLRLPVLRHREDGQRNRSPCSIGARWLK